ncbi:MAG: isopentenyl phosphate kinase [Candidatus Methanomethyliaceae archaeon]|nr:isopentenyl phosphate kinase [Candidatus Methanomethyliaceae archaeon]
MKFTKVDFVIKLGGSAITKKDQPFTPNLEVIKTISLELSQIYNRPSLILVYGGGSFGHHVARRYISGGLIRDIKGTAEIHSAMFSLTKILTDHFLQQDLPVFAINSSSSFILKNGNLQEAFYTPLELSLERGLIPLIGGDVVFDSSSGIRILSGDRIASMLAKTFQAKVLAFGTNVDGILLKGSTVPKIKAQEIEKILDHIKQMQEDVTGGMSGKLREIARYLVEGGKSAIIFNITRPGQLTRLLSGKEVLGTNFES